MYTIKVNLYFLSSSDEINTILNLHMSINLVNLSEEEIMNYKPGFDSLLAVLPYFHIYGQVLIKLGAILGGAKVVTLPKFDPELYLKNILEQQVFCHNFGQFNL